MGTPEKSQSTETPVERVHEQSVSTKLMDRLRERMLTIVAATGIAGMTAGFGLGVAWEQKEDRQAAMRDIDDDLGNAEWRLAHGSNNPDELEKIYWLASSYYYALGTELDPVTLRRGALDRVTPHGANNIAAPLRHTDAAKALRERAGDLMQASSRQLRSLGVDY